jgi:DNA-binding response OmpR family regulator
MNPRDYFDVIFIDLYMPDKCNGIELSRIIKNDYKIITIIVGMGFDLEDEILFREANADYCIIKPLDIRLITKFIRDLQNGHDFCTKNTINVSSLITYSDSIDIDNNNNHNNNEIKMPINMITSLQNWFI